MGEEEVAVDDEELTRRAVAALRAEAEASRGSDGFQPPVTDEESEGVREERRKVRPNNTVVYQNATYGPLPEQLAGETVRLRVTGSEVQVRADSGRVLATYPLQEAEAEAVSVAEGEE